MCSSDLVVITNVFQIIRTVGILQLEQSGSSRANPDCTCRVAEDDSGLTEQRVIVNIGLLFADIVTQQTATSGDDP